MQRRDWLKVVGGVITVNVFFFSRVEIFLENVSMNFHVWVSPISLIKSYRYYFCMGEIFQKAM